MMPFIVMILILLSIGIYIDRPRVFLNSEEIRNKYGLDQYRIQKVDRYENAKIDSTYYYIQQMVRKPFSKKTHWQTIEQKNCGWGDCYWQMKTYKTQEEAEAVVNKLRTGDPFDGKKESTVKYIP